MTPDISQLKGLQPDHDFLVAIDSDGCVFDNMGIKQCECFCPMMIGYFGLQPVAQAARQCKEFADLFSKTRGSNRHKTIVRILRDLLPTHPEVRKLGFDVPQYPHYFAWVDDPKSLLSNEGLQQAILQAKDDQARCELQMALTWSLRVNEMVTEIVRNIPPFPGVRESLVKVVPQADIMVCSSTPYEAIVREWSEHDLDRYIRVIAGQEMGKKHEHLQAASSEKYASGHVLMIGDAPGDCEAAVKAGALFYPINPSDEIASWKRLHDEAFGKFINQTYAGEYQDALILEYESHLPENPTWLT